MRAEDCFIGARVVYNNHRRINKKLTGEIGTVVRIEKDGQEIYIDFDNHSIIRSFGTYIDCVDLFETEPCITMPFDCILNGIKE